MREPLAMNNIPATTANIPHERTMKTREPLSIHTQCDNRQRKNYVHQYVWKVRVVKFRTNNA